MPTKAFKGKLFIVDIFGNIIPNFNYFKILGCSAHGWNNRPKDAFHATSVMEGLLVIKMLP